MLIVSLLPSATEIVCALGLDRSRWSGSRTSATTRRGWSGLPEGDAHR